MFKKTLISLAVASTLGLTGCFDSGSNDKNANPSPKYKDSSIDGKTWPIFNPATKQLPTPNDILFAQELAADGTMAGSSDNAVTIGLDALDGASTVAQFDIKLSGTIKKDSVDGRVLIEQDGSLIPNPTQNVFLLGLDFPGGDALLNNSDHYMKLADANGITLPEGVILPGETPTFDLGILLKTAQELKAALANPDTPDAAKPTLGAQLMDIGKQLQEKAMEYRVEVISLDGGTDNALRITPLQPLDPKKKYLVVVTNEIVDYDGDPLINDPVYNNISTAESPADLISQQLAPLIPAINSWEQLAGGYFENVTNTVRKQVGLPALGNDSISLALTFTTGGTTDVLETAAAPAQFFYRNGLTQTRQGAILQTLVSNLDSWSELSPTEQYTRLKTAAETAVGQAEAASPSLAQIAAGTAAQLNLPSLGVSSPAPSTISVFPGRIPAQAALGQSAKPTDILVGGITLPYYLSIPTESNPEAINAPWVASSKLGDEIDSTGATPPSDKVTYKYPFAEKQGDVSVPLMLSVPDENKCEAAKPWNVVIYQHGIFGNRSHSLALGNQLADNCFVTVAMDLPHHGIAPTLATGGVDPSLAFGADKALDPSTGKIVDSPLPVNERHFGWGQKNGTPVRMTYSLDADQAVGSSGQFFLNLSNLPVARDNLRQAVVDLLNLNASLPSLNGLDLDDNGTAGDDIDVGGDSKLFFAGHSLGGIVGTTFVSVANGAAQVETLGNTSINEITAAALITPGAGVAKLLENSPSISPTVLGQLAKAGLTQGSRELELFLNVAQASIDSAEPLNFAASLASTTPVYINEVYGNGTDIKTKDQTVPVAADKSYGEALNSIEGYTAPLGLAKPAPLAGTEPLIYALEDSGATSGQTVEVKRLASGNHSTVVTAQPLSAFAEIANDVITFFGTQAQQQDQGPQ
ncbi:hypothetical protein DOQ08_00411 [Marinobacter litoralis]|uniref:Bacterial virulence factor lipase N-terminal domain-containing protein n=1 Tax=Marinobacter litoralis TaxID=187981 RepID=A0A3M2RKP2_9GAMM|nr:hypothetical protein [Marinobacter litoralis]RMJ05739.1 hypothetical protein DOQ08_00411 [Marinobacter litoralis]